jgi:hypothetical protein
LQNYAGLLGAQSSIIGQALGQAEEALLAKLGPAKDEAAKDADFAEHSPSSTPTWTEAAEAYIATAK